MSGQKCCLTLKFKHDPINLCFNFYLGKHDKTSIKYSAVGAERTSNLSLGDFSGLQREPDIAPYNFPSWHLFTIMVME